MVGEILAGIAVGPHGLNIAPKPDALMMVGEFGLVLMVLEAGVGGVHDSTNFFTEEELELAVITSISLDHTALLGDTLTAMPGTDCM